MGCRGMAEWNLKGRAFLRGGSDRANVTKIQARLNPLCIHIERYSNYIHIACTLAVPKECPFYAIRTGQQAQLCPGNTRSAIIVRVPAHDSSLADTHVPSHPFHLFSLNI